MCFISKNSTKVYLNISMNVLISTMIRALSFYKSYVIDSSFSSSDESELFYIVSFRFKTYVPSDDWNCVILSDKNVPLFLEFPSASDTAAGDN